jgi:hypothetical protein
MNNINERWRERCAELGLNPQEVKSVSGRYEMYERYTGLQGSEVLPLDRWYKWYRIEKLSEGHAMLTPPVAGCSVGPDTAASGPVVSEADFLQLLNLYRSRGQ